MIIIISEVNVILQKYTIMVLGGGMQNKNNIRQQLFDSKNASAYWTKLTCFHMHSSLKVCSSVGPEYTLAEGA